LWEIAFTDLFSLSKESREGVEREDGWTKSRSGAKKKSVTIAQLYLYILNKTLA